MKFNLFYKNSNTNNYDLDYRADIDGLRAIAVISVILNHAKLNFFGQVFFEGGYLGVDIFFVISGYLITRIIQNELVHYNSFSFTSFYERRARRILPALFFVISFSFPFAYQILIPKDFIEYAESVLSILFFGSNIYFYLSDIEYNATSSLLKPFLHTWSLSVEEQFYLIFPLVALIIYKFFRSQIIAILFFLLICLLIPTFFLEVNKDLNFYSSFTRAWELLAGSILVYLKPIFKYFKNQKIISLLSFCGILLIFLSIIFFTEDTLHPSYFTAFPVLGTMLIITFSSKNEPIGKLLSSRPLVFLGLVSYSAYLWHFPILSYLRYTNPQGIGNIEIFYAISLTLILSIFTFFLVEKPFRSKSLITKKLFVKLIFTSFSAILLLMILIKFNKGYENRIEKIYSSDAINYENKLKGVNKERGRNITYNEKKFALILGDSYISSFSVLGNFISSTYEPIVISYLGCNFSVSEDLKILLQFDKIKKRNKSHCDGFVNGFNNKFFLSNIDVVILTSYRPFNYSINSDRFELFSIIKEI